MKHFFRRASVGLLPRLHLKALVGLLLYGLDVHVMDPFGDVLGDAEAQLGTAQVQLRQYESDPTHEKLMDVNHTLQELSEIVRELSGSIVAVQQNPAQFGLSQIQINQRIDKVGSINNQITDIQQTLVGIRDAAMPLPRNQGQAPPPSSANYSDGVEESADRQLLYQESIREQDDILDSVYATVSSLREQANTMGRELEDQAGYIDDFDMQMDRSGDHLRRGMARVDHVLRHNRDCLSSCCIFILVIVLLILLVIAFIV